MKMMSIIPFSSLLIGLLFLSSSQAYYMPGFSPTIFHKGDPVPLLVNKVLSDQTQLPYAYTDLNFVCNPKEKVESTSLNLGEILSGDRITSSDYKLIFEKSANCEVLCELSITEEQSLNAKKMIKEQYIVEWIIDDLPGATVFQVTDDPKFREYRAGFPLGYYDKQTDLSYINNHVNIVIRYQKNKSDPNEKMIVAFEVYPLSIGFSSRCPPSSIDHPRQLVNGTAQTIRYTYNVQYRETTSITWETRWNLYLLQSDPQVHWWSVFNCIGILLFLTTMVTVIMLRTLKKDIAVYNEEDVKEEQEDTSGWKLVHGDVFRPPKYAFLFAPLIGSGMQMLIMVVATIAFALVGILNPSYRGGMVSYGLFFFAFAGIFAGYYSSRMYKVFKGTAWKWNAFLAATLVPSVLLAFIFILNLFVWHANSSSAIPFGTFFALVAMWFGISLPLVFVGGYFGFKLKSYENPVRTNQIPRQIPEQAWYLQPGASIIIGGLMPFSVIFIELFFILKSIWQDQFYYMFGFLSLVTLILSITCIEITIIITYFQLCGEDYHWWWRSFFVSGASSIYIFLYSIFYYFARLQVTGFVPGLVYFVNSIIACLAYGVVTGTLGFLATYSFMRKIYAGIKVD